MLKIWMLLWSVPHLHQLIVQGTRFNKIKRVHLDFMLTLSLHYFAQSKIILGVKVEWIKSIITDHKITWIKSLWRILQKRLFNLGVGAALGERCDPERQVATGCCWPWRCKQTWVLPGEAASSRTSERALLTKWRKEESSGLRSSSWHKAWCSTRTGRLSNPDAQPRASTHCQLGRYPTVERCTPNKQTQTDHRPVISLYQHMAPVITTDSGSVHIQRTLRQPESKNVGFSYMGNTSWIEQL